MGKAAWNIVWVQLLALAVITAVLGYLTSLIGSGIMSTTTSSTLPLNPAMLQGISLGSSFGQIIAVPLGFFIGMGIFYLIAKAFGGQGTFLAQGYTYLLFWVPLSIIAALFRGTREIALGTGHLIPILCDLVVLAVDIYGIVLSIYSLMAVHRLSGGKATLVVFIPVIVALVLACVVVAIVIAVVAGSHPQP